MGLRDDVMAAFSRVPYPGDEALTSCDCDDCRWEVAQFRGKKWTRLSLDDFGAEDGDANEARLTPAAFHYFLPGLILLALDHPEAASSILGKVIRRFTVSDVERESARSKANQILRRLSARQRQVLVEVIRGAGESVPHVPVIWQSAVANLMDGAVTPYASEMVDRWLAEQHGGRSGLPPAT